MASQRCPLEGLDPAPPPQGGAAASASPPAAAYASPGAYPAGTNASRRRWLHSARSLRAADGPAYGAMSPGGPQMGVRRSHGCRAAGWTRRRRCARPPTPPPPPRPPQPPQARGTPEQQQLVQSSQGTPHEIDQLRTKGIGWMTPQELATRIELANPNASPGVKFQALKQGMQLLNQSGQMQMMQMMQSREFHEDTMRERRLSDDRADARLKLQLDREQRLSPEGVAATQQAKQQVSALIGPAREALKQSTVQFNAVETKEKSLMTQMDVLGKISGNLSITGIKPIDNWVADIRRKFGDAEATKYDAQLKTVQRDAALALSPTVSGHMTDTQRGEVQSFLNGLMSPKTIDALKELFRKDAELNKKVYKGQIKQWQDAIKAGGTLPEEPAAAAPAASAAGGFDRAAAKAKGYTDEEIDKFLAGQK